MAKRHFVIKAAQQPVRAAEGDATPEEAFIDSLDSVKDDFDYALEGLAKIAEDGYRGDAQEIAQRLSDAIQSAIASVSSILAE